MARRCNTRSRSTREQVQQNSRSRSTAKSTGLLSTQESTAQLREDLYQLTQTIEGLIGMLLGRR